MLLSSSTAPFFTMLNLQSLLASSLFASVAVAHFTLDYPVSGGRYVLFNPPC